MKKNLLLWQLLTLLALLVPTAYLAYAWAGLPAQVPTHFGLDGQPNGYTRREHLWLLTLALPLGLAVLLSVLPRLDPKHRIATDTANFQKLRLALVGLVSGLACYCLYVALHPSASSGRGPAVIVGLSFALLGNYLTTVQPNYFVGIRTPWTLESAAVWARTHRVGGILFCLAGLLMVALGLVLPLAWVGKALLGLILGTVAFCYFYSYLLFRQQERLGRSA
ncbi:hypothetical protein AUC43_01235 [Hymenobacter sedentarius]|uniref:DUF1648 domain-containing protein n=1 Tax=Hymenobacter sedentarius TaxID=1411621 RepID=A0A0U3SCF0_9BACT|nr:SdpI family protein [Hymenobacter sedentarius]ALW83844.1 hypothetical protein AUC43_01235 [Hymenobacter sedentarius]